MRDPLVAVALAAVVVLLVVLVLYGVIWWVTGWVLPSLDAFDDLDGEGRP